MEELTQILEAAHLSYLPSREGGWQTRKEWREVLSGGEKQRVSKYLSACATLNILGTDGNGESVLSQAQVCYSRW